MAELVNSENVSAKENILGTLPVGKLLKKFAVPGIISMVVNSLYNLIDQIFIGQGVNTYGNGATSVVFPISTLFLAFALLLGDGAASYMSLRLGEKRKEEAARGTASGIVALVIVGVVLTIVTLIFIRPLCLLFGASDMILPYAIDYGTITALGFPFVAFCAGGSSIIRADGKPIFNMIGLLVGCVFNLVFDPIFIFVLHWGVKGAALATIMGQCANALLNIWYLKKRLQSVEVTKQSFHQWWKTVLPVCKLGISSFITEASLVIAILARNQTLRYYGGLSKYGESTPVTTLGITMKVFSILLGIVLGLASGAQPIFGYNYGAGKYDRVKKTYKLVVIIATLVSVLAFVAAQAFPLQIVSIFGKADEPYYNEFAVKCMRIYLGLIPLAGFQMATGPFFQATGYPVQASLMSLSKQIIFQLPATLLLPIYLGVEGCLWAGPVSDFCAFTLTLILLLVYWKKIFSKPAYQVAEATATPEATEEKKE